MREGRFVTREEQNPLSAFKGGFIRIEVANFFCFYLITHSSVRNYIRT